MSEDIAIKVKIMVVDDEVDLEPLVRQKFRKQIRDNVYDFVFAHNGLEALSKLIEYPEIGVILSDINMPEMDGLTLLMKLKELKHPGLKTVVVSAYGDMDNIRTAMNRGAFDFVTKPVNFEDLEITINKTMDEILQIRKGLEEHDQLISIQQDLQTAREIQQAILPKVFSPFPNRNDFEIYAAMNAAKEVGGDFYDFFLIDNDRIGFVIGDVSGKGVPAAIFMAVSRTIIRATGIKGGPADECMNYVNNLLCNESVASMFVTVFYGILNTATGELEYVNAGHNPPYLINSSGIKTVELTRGTVLGGIEHFNYRSLKMQLAPGDILYLYTDGVTEAFNRKGELYGDDRLEEVLKANLQTGQTEIVKIVLTEVAAFAAGFPPSDDITMMAIKFMGR